MRDLAATEFLSISDCLKATPAEEGGERFVYLEASNEALDHQGEVILAKALEASASYYLKFGNLDIDHITQIGMKAGIPNYPSFEIGVPVDVKVKGRRTFVKGQIYRGDGPVAARANEFWDSLTKLSPAQRWYPSVGGAVLEKAQELDPQTKDKRTTIRKVRWTNIGMSRTPVNLDLPTATTVPIEAFAKSWGPGGLDLTKALTANPGVTDAAALTAGGALAKQSLEPRVQSYWDFRERVAADLRRHRVQPNGKALFEHSTRNLHLGEAEASEFIERFMADVGRLTQKRNH